MPRIRAIKPQFWLDEELATVPIEARLLYIGLWNLADDSGVFEYRPGRIRVQLFPYDLNITNEMISNWLISLEKIGNIERFEDSHKDYALIKAFLKHQQIQHPSKFRFIEDSDKFNEGSMSSHEDSPKEKVQGKGTSNKEKEKQEDSTPTPSKGSDTDFNEDDILLPGITIKKALMIAQGKSPANETNRERCMEALKDRGLI